MTRCPLCNATLAPQYRLECVNAVNGVWKLRLSCTNPSCAATGMRGSDRRWIFFDEIVARPRIQGARP